MKRNAWVALVVAIFAVVYVARHLSGGSDTCMRVATLTQEVRQPIRHVNQTGGDYVAIFTLRLTPVRNTPDVCFINELRRPEVELWIVAAIQKGVEIFVSERQAGGAPVGGLRVALVDIDIHPTDSKESAFTYAGYKAMQQAFQCHETLIDSGELKNET